MSEPENRSSVLFAAVGLLASLLVVGWFVLGGDEDEQAEPTPVATRETPRAQPTRAPVDRESGGRTVSNPGVNTLRPPGLRPPRTDAAGNVEGAAGTPPEAVRRFQEEQAAQAAAGGNQPFNNTPSDEGPTGRPVDSSVSGAREAREYFADMRAAFQSEPDLNPETWRAIVTEYRDDGTEMLRRAGELKDGGQSEEAAAMMTEWDRQYQEWRARAFENQ